MSVGCDFHIEHIVLVAAIEAIGFNDVVHGCLAELVAIEEEVDEHRLTCIEDAVKVDFVAVDIDGSKVRHNVAAAAGCGGDRFLNH